MDVTKLTLMMVIVISYRCQGCYGAGYGEICTDDDNCTDTNTVCNSGTNKCGCDTGYTRNVAINACYKGCSEPPSATAHSALISMTGTTYGSTASYTCDIWYRLSSSSLIIQCTASGDWEAAPSCAITKNALGSGCPNPSTGLAATESCGDNNARCTLSGNSYTCQCLSQYYDSNGSTGSGTCVLKKNLDVSCPRPSTTNVKASDSCSDSKAACVAVSSSSYQCKCTLTYYNKDGSCTPKVSLGYSCPKSDACATSNAQCRSGTCSCTVDYYDDNGSGNVNGNCVRKVGLGIDCPMPDACATGNAECSGNKCKCKEEYYDSNTESSNVGACLSRKDLYATCNTQSPYNRDQCKDTNAKCDTSNICKCNAGYHLEASTCVPNVALGGLCRANVTNECSDSAAICSNGKCICGDDHYDSNGFNTGGNCKDMTELKVGGLTFSSISTTAFTVGWTPPADKTQYIYSYKLEWRPTDNTADGGGSESLQSTAVSRTISSNIISGRAYRVTITSRNNQTQTGVDRVTSVSKEQATKPQTPGPLKKTSDIDITSKEITIDWIVPDSSDSVASDYHVEIFDGTESKANKTVTSAIADISFPNMRYGYTYKIQITANSQKFDGNHVVPSDVYMAEIMTLVIVPKKPTNVSISDVHSRSFKVSWIIDDPRPGITTYTIMVYGHPDIATSKNVIVQGFEQRSTTIQELQEFWNYSVAVKASTSAGSETSDTTEQIKTPSAAPGKVSEFEITTPQGDYTKLEITWKMPVLLERNSIIARYVFEYEATDGFVSSKTARSENHVYIETVIVIPEGTYTFKVYAVNKEEQHGEQITETVHAPAGVPRNDVENVQGKEVINVGEYNTQTMIEISIMRSFLEQDVYGKIRLTGLIGCAQDKCDFTGLNGQSIDKFNSMDNWSTASKTGFMTYRISPAQWTDASTESNVILYRVGEGRCNDIEAGYCNGPLTPSTSYMLRAVVCSNGGCLVSKTYGPYRTEAASTVIDYYSNSNSDAAIVGAVLGCVVLILVIVIIVGYVYHKRLLQAAQGKGHTDQFADIKEIPPQRRNIAITNEAFTGDTEVVSGQYMDLDEATRTDTYDTIEKADTSVMALEKRDSQSTYETPDITQATKFKSTDKKGHKLYQNV